MTTLTVNIDDKQSEKAVKAFLDNLGLNYSIATSDWWQDENLIKELDKRSKDLTSGKDKGIPLSEIKAKLLKL